MTLEGIKLEMVGADAVVAAGYYGETAVVGTIRQTEARPGILGTVIPASFHATTYETSPVGMSHIDSAHFETREEAIAAVKGWMATLDLDEWEWRL